MLFVKNLVFLDGAIATLAPDLDLFAEIAAHLDVLREHPRRAHRRRDRHRPDQFAGRPRGIKAGFGIVDGDVERLTYRDLQERREIIRRRLDRR